MTVPPPLPQSIPRPRSWLRRYWPWLVAACVVALLLFAAVVALFISTVFGVMKKSTVYVQAVAAAHADPAVQSALGEPITESWMVQGTVNTRDLDARQSGDATFVVPLEGPRGKGTLYAEARLANGTWTYQTLAVDLPSGRVELPHPGTGTPTPAP